MEPHSLHDFDLLVMLEKEHEGILDTLFYQSLANKMEFSTWFPLLSYNEHYLSQTDRQDIVTDHLHH